MNALRIDFLPKHLQKEIKDFYEFLISKHQLEQKSGMANEKRPYALARGEFTVPDDLMIRCLKTEYKTSISNMKVLLGA